jgi:hypothetical protein
MDDVVDIDQWNNEEKDPNLLGKPQTLTCGTSTL